ncbi:MAG: RNA-binding protein [Nitrospinae bacterium]|nr:RNA-binding protein [Nitrospinota bacterium]
MPVRLFVGNLSYHATEAELREHFSGVGPLLYVHLPTDRETGKPRGFAFVEFNDPAHAEEAIRRFNNQPFQGRPLAVNEARARESGPGVRRNASAQPSLTPTDWGSGGGVAETRPSHRGSASRNFGPDAPSHGERKPANRRPKSTRTPKGPIRERLGGQFFAGDEDDADGDAANGGNIARRLNHAEREDHD